jgi:threonine dehydrogenase-like Zn-dependent dehydrogenase
MRAFVLSAPGECSVQDVPAPVAVPGEVVVDVERVGVCGTDVEFFTGEMAYLHEGHSSYPMRLGHEWSGRVAAVGDGVDRAWVGRRVMGDTMLGDGVCRRCRKGHQHAGRR